MSPATIERRRLGMRDDEGQLTLDGLSGARPAPGRAATAMPRPVAPGAPVAPAAPGAPAPAPAAGGTLDDLISGVCRELGAQRVAACPVCGDHLHVRPGGRIAACRGCGSSLS
jgi:hypothetical protein